MTESYVHIHAPQPTKIKKLTTKDIVRKTRCICHRCICKMPPEQLEAEDRYTPYYGWEVSVKCKKGFGCDKSESKMRGAGLRGMYFDESGADHYEN